MEKVECLHCGAMKVKGEECPGCRSFDVVVQQDDLPVGILCLTNISRCQWNDVMEEYRRRVGSGGVNWRGIVVVHGLDPKYETKATYTEIPKP